MPTYPTTFPVTGSPAYRTDDRAVYEGGDDSVVHYNFKKATTLAQATRRGPVPSLTRSSNAVRKTDAGIFETVGNDVARFDHRYNATTGLWEPAGVLLEEDITNEQVRSEEFEDAVWQTVNGAVNADVAVALDGNTTADRFLDDNGGGTGSVYITDVFTLTADDSYTYSIFAKKDGLSWIWMRALGIDAPGGVYFDIENGVVGTVDTLTKYGIIPYGNGWFRCWIGFSSTTDLTGSMRLQVADADGDNIVDRDGTSSVFLWGAQLEQEAYPTSYIKTTSATVTRAQEKLTATLSSGLTELTLYLKARTAPGFVDSLGQEPVRVGVNQNNIQVIRRESHGIRIQMITGGTNVFEKDFTDPGHDTVFELAAAWGEGKGQAVITGQALQEDLSAPAPAALVDVLLGHLGGTWGWDSHVQEFRLWDTPKFDARLEALIA